MIISAYMVFLSGITSAIRVQYQYIFAWSLGTYIKRHEIHASQQITPRHQSAHVLAASRQGRLFFCLSLLANERRRYICKPSSFDQNLFWSWIENGPRSYYTIYFFLPNSILFFSDLSKMQIHWKYEKQNHICKFRLKNITYFMSIYPFLLVTRKKRSISVIIQKLTFWKHLRKFVCVFSAHIEWLIHISMVQCKTIVTPLSAVLHY